MAIRHACAVVACDYPIRTGTGDILQYAADAAGDLGFTALKLFLTPNYAGGPDPTKPDYPGQDWDTTYNTLVNLAQDSGFATVFGDARFDRFFIDVWSFANGIFNPWVTDITTAQLASEYTEWYELAGHLLSTYAGKEFVLQSGAESDWALLADFNPALSVPPYRVERYAAFLNVHQRAIEDATRDNPSTATVRHAVEVNRVLDDYGTRMHRDVFPLIKADAISYTAYEAINDATGFARIARTSGLTSNNDIRGLAYGAGVFVAVGEGGQLSTSTNGTLWVPRTSGFGASDINAVMWSAADSLFIACGADGKISTSPDGIVWTARTSGVATALRGVIASSFGTAMWAFGDATVILFSINGIAWNPVSFIGGPPAGSPDFLAGHFDADSSNFVIAGTGGKLVYGGGGVAVSVNPGFGASTIRSVTSNAGTFIVAGDDGKITTSSYGGPAPYTVRTSGFGASHIAKVSGADGVFVACGADGKLSTSPTGATWTAQTTGTAAALTALHYSVAEDVWVFGTADGVVGASIDTLAWTLTDANVSGLQVNALADTAGLTVCAAVDTLLTTSTYWLPRRALEANVAAGCRKALRRIKAAMPGVRVYVGEFAWPQDESWFTALDPDVGNLIQIVLDVAQAEGVTDAVYWQIFDNEEQSPGVPRGFSLYDRDGNAVTPGALNAAGLKYQALLA